MARHLIPLSVPLGFPSFTIPPVVVGNGTGHANGGLGGGGGLAFPTPGAWKPLQQPAPGGGGGGAAVS